MNNQEEKIQKALGTFDHFKCTKCDKVSYKNELIPIIKTEIIYQIGGPSFQEIIEIGYRCPFCKEEFE